MTSDHIGPGSGVGRDYFYFSRRWLRTEILLAVEYTTLSSICKKAGEVRECPSSFRHPRIPSFHRDFSPALEADPEIAVVSASALHILLGRSHKNRGTRSYQAEPATFCLKERFSDTSSIIRPRTSVEWPYCHSVPGWSARAAALGDALGEFGGLEIAGMKCGTGTPCGPCCRRKAIGDARRSSRHQVEDSQRPPWRHQMERLMVTFFSAPTFTLARKECIWQRDRRAGACSLIDQIHRRDAGDRLRSSNTGGRWCRRSSASPVATSRTPKNS